MTPTLIVGTIFLGVCWLAVVWLLIRRDKRRLAAAKPLKAAESSPLKCGACGRPFKDGEWTTDRGFQYPIQMGEGRKPSPVHLVCPRGAVR